jgi:hypothetical protein
MTTALRSPHLHADVAELPPTLPTVGLLARLRLDCRRSGIELRITGASFDLRELVDLCGLTKPVLAARSSELKGDHGV